MLPALLKPTISTRFAVFRPTPGNVSSSSIVVGTLPPNACTSRAQQSLRYRAL
jgi:hypothetical protein